MSWIALGGRSVGKGGGGGGGGGGSNSEEYGGGGGGGGRSFRGVPLCGAAMCSGKGMPPPRLPQPGIDCVNRDRPCLPCDIVNLKLRASVTGIRVKRAVAECQKRYFCSVWNLLFGLMFPDHRPSRCRNLQSGDLEVNCRKKSRSSKKPATQRDRGRDVPRRRQLPYGADPGRAISPVTEDMPMRDRRPKQRLVDDAPLARVESGTRPAVVADKSDDRKPMIVGFKARPAVRQRDRAGLRYNIWDMPMLDSTKGKK